MPVKRTAPFEKTCPTCAATFSVGGRGRPSKEAVYCSIKCFTATLKKSTRVKHCLYCSEPFRTKREGRGDNQKHCSPACSNATRAKALRTARRDSVRDMSETEKAWLAALIDSEGNIRIDYPARGARKDYRYPRITIVNTCLPLLKRAQQITSVGRRYTRQKEKEHHKQCWMWIVNGFAASRILEQIRPYLIAKTKIADEVLSIRLNP